MIVFIIPLVIITSIHLDLLNKYYITPFVAVVVVDIFHDTFDSCFRHYLFTNSFCYITVIMDLHQDILSLPDPMDNIAIQSYMETPYMVSETSIANIAYVEVIGRQSNKISRRLSLPAVFGH